MDDILTFLTTMGSWATGAVMIGLLAFVATGSCFWAVVPLLSVERPTLWHAWATLRHGARLLVYGGIFAAVDLLWAKGISAHALTNWQAHTATIIAGVPTSGTVPSYGLYLQLQADYWATCWAAAFAGPPLLFAAIAAFGDTVNFLVDLGRPVVEVFAGAIELLRNIVSRNH
jgi:hypothetical protein